mgnify:CR=1 FL=1
MFKIVRFPKKIWNLFSIRFNRSSTGTISSTSAPSSS